MSRAPIALFVYNRVDHVKKVIEKLSKNDGAGECELYIFSDGPQSNSTDGINEVREYIHSLKKKRLFKNIVIKEAEFNQGLAKSIINGVTEIINEYGRIIVIEDDVLTTIDFLNFMNDCLNEYEENNCIWSIGGTNIMGTSPDGKDIFLAQRTCSCAWATWKNRWDKVDWEVRDFKKFNTDKNRRNEFCKYGNDRLLMLREQQKGIVNSWAIRFCFAEFNAGMYTVYPSSTKAKNIGYDGSGTHCGADNGRFSVELPDGKVSYQLKYDLLLQDKIKERFQLKFHLPWYYIMERRLKMFLGIKNFSLSKMLGRNK